METEQNHRRLANEQSLVPSKKDSNLDLYFTTPELREDMTANDILAVNWSAVEHSLREGIDSIRDEGGLERVDFEQVFNIIRLALNKLAQVDGELRHRLNLLPDAHWIQSILAWTPTEIGEKVRAQERIRKQAIRGREQLKVTLDEITTLKKELAQIVDEKVHERLLNDNASYRELSTKFDEATTVATNAKEILNSLGKKEFATRAQLHFYTSFDCEPRIRDASSEHYTHLERTDDLFPGIKKKVQELEQEARRLDVRLTALREKYKTEIYSGANK